MEKIGIIAAMQEEFDVVKALLTDIDIVKKYNLEFCCGKFNEKDIVLVQCGVGKVNAARVTQAMIDLFEMGYIINVGVAGSLNDDLEIGDIVVGKTLVQHDFDITAGGHEKGYISNELGKYFKSDNTLIAKCETVAEALMEVNLKIGTIATGDVFCTEISMKEEIVKNFGADCVEMEGAAIAQVCTLCNIPFLVIRSISDKPNGHNVVDFETHLVSSSKKFGKLIELLI